MSRQKARPRRRRGKAPKPGASWRVLAQGPGADGRVDVRGAGVFDELVVDGWLHLEQMTERSYWMQLGPLRFSIVLRPSGEADIGIERDGDTAGKVTVFEGVDTGGMRLPGAPWWPGKGKLLRDTGVLR